MLMRRVDGRSASADRRLAWSLAGIAGAVNAAGFYAVGLYSSHMTGTMSTMAEHLALNNLTGIGVGLGIVAAFVAGAALSAILINVGERRHLHGIYAYSVLAEAALLAGLACADLWLPEMQRGPFLVLGLSFLVTSSVA